MFEPFAIFFVGILKVFYLPFHLIINLLNFFYKSVFFFQFFMSDTCYGIFGNSLGCNLLNPNYVFTLMIKNLLFISLTVFMLLKGYEAWIVYNDNTSHYARHNRHIT